MQDLALLGIYAHPDDEQLMSGVLAKAASEGIRTGIVCATRGEVGEIADPSLATPETLGQVREGELRAAVSVLGVKYLWFLDYRDSGMAGTPPNQDPRSFNLVDHDKALEEIVAIIREFKPTVIVTFDRTGGYGHPDHLMIHKLATEAFHAAADPRMYPESGEPWQAQRLYYSAFPRSFTSRIGQFMKDMGLETGFPDLENGEFGVPDEELTSAVDVREWVPLKEKSLSLHRTQMDPKAPFARLPRSFMEELRSTEHFALGAGVPLPEGDQANGDLFSGLREQA